MALFLRAAVYCEVLGAGRSFQIRRVVALEAAHKSRAHLPGEERVLAPCLLPAPPAGIPEDVDIWTPEGKPLVEQVAAVAAQRLVELRTALVADRAGDALDQRRIPRGGHADGLREDGRAAVARHAVQGLVPIVVGRDAQPGNGRAGVAHLADLLVQRQAADEVGHPSRQG